MFQVYRNSNSPTYKEKFVLGMDTAELAKRTLMFYVYASDKLSNTLIGEAELRLCDVTMRQPVTTWLTLTDTGQVNKHAKMKLICHSTIRVSHIYRGCYLLQFLVQFKNIIIIIIILPKPEQGSSMSHKSTCIYMYAIHIK